MSRPTHTVDDFLIPSMGEAREREIERILADLKAQGRVPIGQPHESFSYGSSTHHHLTVVHQSVEDAEREAREREAPTTLEPVGEWTPGMERYDAPAGQAGRDLIEDRERVLEAEGYHILSHESHPTDRPGNLRYAIRFRQRTVSEDRIYEAIQGASSNGKSTRQNRKARAT